jgi:predicted nucleic acid-binding Zn ribbon protein
MNTCIECGNGITQVEKKREKKFCSSTCRSNNWQKSKRKSNAVIKVVEIEGKYDPVTPPKAVATVITPEQSKEVKESAIKASKELTYFQKRQLGIK